MDPLNIYFRHMQERNLQSHERRFLSREACNFGEWAIFTIWCCDY